MTTTTRPATTDPGYYARQAGRETVEYGEEGPALPLDTGCTLYLGERSLPTT